VARCVPDGQRDRVPAGHGEDRVLHASVERAPVAEVELRSGDADVVAGRAGVEMDRERSQPGQRSGGERCARRLRVSGGRGDRDRRLRAIGVAGGVADRERDHERSRRGKQVIDVTPRSGRAVSEVPLERSDSYIVRRASCIEVNRDGRDAAGRCDRERGVRRHRVVGRRDFDHFLRARLVPGRVGRDQHCRKCAASRVDVIGDRAARRSAVAEIPQKCSHAHVVM